MGETDPAAQPPKLPMFDARHYARRLSNLLIACAIAMALYTPVTTALGEYHARQVEDRYNDTVDELAASLPPAEPGSLANADPDFSAPARALYKRLSSGKPVARLRIPKIDVDEVVVAGSRYLSLEGDDSALRSGPAIIRNTSLPGLGSNTGIAGHRTTYTHPFWSLDQVEKGDRIILEMPYGTFTYRVFYAKSVKPNRSDLVRDHGYEELALSTCDPRFSATHRLVVRAKLVSAKEPAS